MDQFSSTDEAITFSLADFAIRSDTQLLVSEEVNGLESYLPAAVAQLVSHL